MRYLHKSKSQIMKKQILFIVLLTFLLPRSEAQLVVNPDLPGKLATDHWDASWISVPGSPEYGYGVYLYRNKISIDQVPGEFIVHVSADNRYKLYINGKLTGLGPARSDPDHWNYETYDLSEFLHEGENVIAAEVWNFGPYKPWAQLSLFSAFIVQGSGSLSSQLNTPGTWKCRALDAIQPVEVSQADLGTFIIVGPGDRVDGRSYPWGWKTVAFDDSGWSAPETKFPGASKGVGTDITHALVPRTIPAMELREINPPVVRKQDQEIIDEAADVPFSITPVPANTKTQILLDQEELVTAYPHLKISGGRDAKIWISYAESLFDDKGRKPHRDSVAGMHFVGNSDLIISDGGKSRTYNTLWFRTFRYILLEIETKSDPLIIESFEPLFTAYPFREKGWFHSDDPQVAPIWEVGWRTARLCANELYYDCPYYEQMQYVGDTRIQALISLYVDGDDRLMKKAITDYYHSIIPEGLTQSRYPTEPRQVIPTYSLFWISMISDYIWHRNDYAFAAQYLVNIQHVLQWFENRIDPETGMLGGIEYWPFVDWTEEWPWDNEKRIGGVPPGGQEGQSSIITFQYAMTLNQAAELFDIFGLEKLAADYRTLAGELIESTRKHCWDEARKLFADTPGMNSYSQHANTFALLAGAIKKEDQAIFMEEVMRDPALIQASLYFRYYVNRAAIEAGLGHKYLSMLQPWRRMLGSGLTTFAEIPDTERTRSDCHAWSASPLYELLATVAGIMPAAPGFGKLIIEPHPGGLGFIDAGMPHPKGMITVDLTFGKNGAVKGTVTLPPGLDGIFVWDHQTIDIVPGKQKIKLDPLGSKFKLR